ncbi:hypothetical protein SALBM217S_05233 [Streptomyces griseoloalbus]
MDPKLGTPPARVPREADASPAALRGTGLRLRSAGLPQLFSPPPTPRCPAPPTPPRRASPVHHRPRRHPRPPPRRPARRGRPGHLHAPRGSPSPGEPLLRPRQGAARCQPWKGAFDRMAASKYADLNRTPRPRAVVECGSDQLNLGCTDEREDAIARVHAGPPVVRHPRRTPRGQGHPAHGRRVRRDPATTPTPTRRSRPAGLLLLGQGRRDRQAHLPVLHGARQHPPALPGRRGPLQLLPARQPRRPAGTRPAGRRPGRRPPPALPQRQRRRSPRSGARASGSSSG